MTSTNIWGENNNLSDSDSDLFCQHTTFSNSNVYKNNEIIKYADMEAPIKTSYGRYHRATRKIN